MLDFASITQMGDRSTNEDYLGVTAREGRYCFVVCDGLGGHGMGDVASRLVVNVFEEQFNNCDSCDGFLSSTFLIAQEQLRAHQSEKNAKNKMLTTAAALFLDGKHAHIGYIGDSRVYMFDPKGVRKLTLDHSVPQMLALAGEISEDDIRKHPDRNIILRALGTEWERPMFELLPSINLSECHAFLLCTDGFWEYISESEMLSLLKNSKTATQWLDAMSAVVRKHGANDKMDNYSAIAVLNFDSCNI